MSEPCKMCRERGKVWKGDDPRCAFHGVTFDEDNWMCATMNALRNVCADSAVWNDDRYVGVITVPESVTEDWTDDGPVETHIVLHWYKRRGCTQGAIVFLDDGSTCPLDIDLASAVAKFYEAKT